MFQFYFIHSGEASDEISFHPKIVFQYFEALEGEPYSSHLAVLEKFLNTNNEYLVILENNIILSCNFSERIFNLTDELNSDWGIIWLGQNLDCHTLPVIFEYSKSFLSCSISLGAFGYLVNRKGATAILNYCKGANSINYDDILTRVCEEEKYPKLILKEPLVYANVWNTPAVSLHEQFNLNMYRRDFELNLLMHNPNLLEYFNDKHLLLGKHSDDLSDNEIKTLFKFFRDSKNPHHLKSLFTYKQTVITDFIEEDLNYFGRGLYFLRFIPTKVFFRNPDSIKGLPKLPLVEYIRGPLVKNKESIYIQLTKYHYLNRWTFSTEFKDATRIGDRCFDFPAKNYFYHGDVNKAVVSPSFDIFVKELARVGEIKKSFSFIRNLGEFTDLSEKINELSKRLNYENNHIAFTHSPVHSYIGNLKVIDQTEYPEILVVQGDTRIQGKFNILDLRIPLDYDVNKYQLIILPYMKETFAKNEIYVPIFTRLISNLEALGEMKNLNIEGEKQHEIAKLENYDSLDYPVATPANAKFTIIMENFNLPGYITEKIILTLNAGSIPIYIGCKEILDFINPEVMIYIPSVDKLSNLSITTELFDYEKAKTASVWKQGIPCPIYPWLQ